MKARSLFYTVAVLLVAGSLSGCVALAVGAAGGAAGAVYVKGRLVDNVNAPVTAVYNASRSMLNAKGLPIKDEKADVASAHLRSEYADGDDIRIEIEAVTSEVSKIKIRVGLTGDHNRSLDLLNGIKARL
jgi:hypothetical protein